jgi:hypothetical protein
MGDPRENLTVMSGDPRSVADLRAALPGHDAVLSSLGPPGGGPRRSTVTQRAVPWPPCRPPASVDY